MSFDQSRNETPALETRSARRVRPVVERADDKLERLRWSADAGAARRRGDIARDDTTSTGRTAGKGVDSTR
jgi:hypothetical protein